MLLLIPLLGGCAVAAGAVAGADAGSVVVFGRDIVDLGVSAVSGKDCSIVRLDKGQNYCAPREHLPGEQRFCSNTLGTVMCWANPESFAVLPQELADTPALTPDQAKSVAARWPKSLNISD